MFDGHNGDFMAKAAFVICYFSLEVRTGETNILLPHSYWYHSACPDTGLLSEFIHLYNTSKEEGKDIAEDPDLLGKLLKKTFLSFDKKKKEEAWKAADDVSCATSNAYCLNNALNLLYRLNVLE